MTKSTLEAEAILKQPRRSPINKPMRFNRLESGANVIDKVAERVQLLGGARRRRAVDDGCMNPLGR
jgi:hypothetical protein